MNRFETYRSNAAEAPLMRKWLFRAFILSLLIHGALVVFFQMKKLEGFAVPETETLAPPKFVVNQVAIDPKLLEQPPEPRVPPTKNLPTAAITVPSDKPETRDVEFRPQTQEIVTPLLNDTSKPAPTNWDAISKSQANSAGRGDRELSDLATALLDKNTATSAKRVIKLPPGTKGGDGVNGIEGIPGRQSIDDALSQAGGPPTSDKPIGMPGGALFEYNKADLREEAIGELMKIARLTELYPKATFVISGHTDSVGTPAYNRQLSERRAEAVKEWLVANMGVAEQRIQTVGKGATELIVPADRSIEEQQPNRRVEIVVKTNLK
jgi:outer membrane protein OmpA-like peptidoglycan-associated protein